MAHHRTTQSDARDAVAAPKSPKAEKTANAKNQDKALKDSFPASDPPASANPGSGITGPVETRTRSR